MGALRISIQKFEKNRFELQLKWKKKIILQINVNVYTDLLAKGYRSDDEFDREASFGFCRSTHELIHIDI